MSLDLLEKELVWRTVRFFDVTDWLKKKGAAALELDKSCWVGHETKRFSCQWQA